MKLLLSQREIVVPNSMDQPMSLDAVERSWYTFLGSHEVLVFPNTVSVPANLNYDCLILTGGPDSVNRHLTENALFKHAQTHSRPVLGVCHGAFAVNDLTGGINSKVSGHEACFHKVFFDGQEHMVNSHHVQMIQRLGPEMVAIALDEQGNIEAFQHQIKPIYGIVWHPERMDIPALTPAVKKLLEF